jgi:K+-sensing histidine kinase KdpD
MPVKHFSQSWLGYLVSVVGVAAATALLKFLGQPINPTTVALAFLLIVLFVATAWGSRPAILASVLAMLCFNFFFLPPIGTLTIADPDNWIALFAFLITAVTAGELSARVKRRAEEAEDSRREIERLYQELQQSFERASETEALRRSERLKSALLDAVTHDLRTPLTSIKASVTTLLEEVQKRNGGEGLISLGTEGRKEMLEVINEETDRLDRFIGGLMELARIEAGEMQLRKHWGSVEEIVAAAIYRTVPLTKKHRVEVSLDEELPAVRVDERAVAEVIYTLIDNAAKYSPAGTVITVSAKSGENETVRFAVADAGPGVPTNLREQVFDKFYRAIRDGDAGGNRPSGSGMGLAIARGIVDAHGGRIWIEDGLQGRGTKVIVELPTGDQDAPSEQLPLKSN